MKPGEELVDADLRGLAAGVESPEALLVSIAAPWLSRYNVLIRRLVSFERAAEREQTAASRA